MYYKNILELIGNTPLVKINKLNPNPKVSILAKLEYLNPGGSVKDRIGITMIEGAEKKGILKKGSEIVEATSGNTGIGLAMASAVKGYKCTFTMPDWMSKSKEDLLKAFGATVVRCPTAVPIDDPRGYKTTAKRLSLEKKAFLPDQYSNPDNPKAHYQGTGPEIWKQTEGKVDYVVFGIGTGGTATGTIRYLKKKNPKIKFIAPDPIGSVYSGTLGPFFIEGIGHIFFPKNVDLSLVDEFIRLPSKSAIEMARKITREEGILAGPSAGASLFAAIAIAKRLKNPTSSRGAGLRGASKKNITIVALFPDSGERYLDYLYNEDFEVPLVPKHETKKGFATASIHAHLKNYQDHKALVPPTGRSAIFTFDNVDEAAKIFEGSNKAKENRSKYVYARGNHPQQRQLEETVATLEGGTDAVAFSSGMAAITAFVQTLLTPGDEVVASNVLYGDSYHLLRSIMTKWGVKTHFTDITNLSEVAKLTNKKTKLIYTETPTNPLLSIADIGKLSEIAHKNKAVLAVDNTFSSPYLQQPLRLGADVVIESTTKYLSGHSDALGGVVIANSQDFIMKLWGTLFVTGAVLDPAAAALILRGIKTLSLRMEKHCDNAKYVAKYLVSNPKIIAVHYPGLLNHPQHDLARVQMNGYGGIVSFEVRGGIVTGKKFVNNLKLFSLSVSLGAVESLVNHPASMTHKIIPRENRLKAGITDGLIRLSLGIEDSEDLVADLEQAFTQI